MGEGGGNYVDSGLKQLRLPLFFLARQEIADTFRFRFLLMLASHWTNLEGSVTWWGAPSGDAGRSGTRQRSASLPRLRSLGCAVLTASTLRHTL